MSVKDNIDEGKFKDKPPRTKVPFDIGKQRITDIPTNAEMKKAEASVASTTQ